MAIQKVEAPRFRLALLHPRYWPTWLGVAVLYLISWLPYKAQLALGRGLGRFLGKIAKSRVRVARRNLELCFPEQSAAEREALLKANLEATGVAMLETGMAWWWPQWRIKKHMQVENFEYVREVLDSGQGVILMAMHFVTLEIGARMFGEMQPGVGFYRPHNNALMEYLQYHGRVRSNKYLVDKRDVRGMVQALREGEVVWYAPDQDYGRRRAVFVPFFKVPDAATVTATSMFAKQGRAKVVPFVQTRLADGSGYKLSFSPALNTLPSGDEVQDTKLVNAIVEREIRKQPEQYMWVHRRFKTRPNEADPSYY
ncbi:LpxL/LpxP family Kdo(2)-lipid IV(A) lauroyl/palmitoleoyl acyltransferase [Gallaecimonas kandeliae]|uniref:LpxL/LpxP family Kdo(2)-lipid IV(A) lauroyl/palmitoleoyl acyltransferase n=1 Tax=Gallaecimonas kandeliae TaxID=3029055 RepID=UPI0026498781|nr:LpxL/LpxP family Kdo(2)-lipid IV(A) lauroyl/palmitoleoyl acyltransferase [Gallaecimonas kandeliae]WKE64746.1 LpxL/LpxP family Kdo(2)-lipid IV(A) lauroyl/palmitoleoyl acyltransferase [Gallaecimonas kandeliae]